MEEIQTLDLLKEKINTCETIEEKVSFVIEFMKTTLSSGKTPRFREFWDAKKLALDLFQEKMNPISRANSWKDYTELTVEAKRLKEILDEQAAFAIEQIELALASFEKDLENYEAQIAKFQTIDIPEAAYTLRKKSDFYAPLQRELGFLNNMAMRLNSLRKEVIKTDMRIRFKNKILQRLSTLGDHIFPKRKELIKAVSETFISDVEGFIEKNFVQEGSARPPLFQLREEIKAFQEMAKLLTINTQAFQESRKKLSQSWESLRELDKERKKELGEKKEIFKENYTTIKAKVDALTNRIAEATLNSHQIIQEVDDLLSEMREIELSKEGVKALKDELFAIKKEQNAKRRELEREAQAKRDREQEERASELAALLEKWQNTFDNLTSLGALHKAREEFQLAVDALALSQSERPDFEKIFNQINERALELEENELLNSKKIDESLLEALERALSKRDEARDASEKTLRALRKEEGSSGLDFERAMRCRERIDEERERLMQIERSIERLQNKINEIAE